MVYYNMKISKLELQLVKIWVKLFNKIKMFYWVVKVISVPKNNKINNNHKLKLKWSLIYSFWNSL